MLGAIGWYRKKVEDRKIRKRFYLEDGKIIPNEYDFSPRKEPFTDMKPFQAGRKFAFDHIACVGCDSIFVNGPQPTDNSVTGPFGWTPYTEIGTDPASWKLLNSAEHAPLAGSVAFINPLKAPPPPPAPSASKGKFLSKHYHCELLAVS